MSARVTAEKRTVRPATQTRVASSHPVTTPAGMRDLLPPMAARRRGLVDTLLGVFASYGYALVDTPSFEYASVLEPGLHTMDRRELLRFVEPETGEVALLRPDITPQIARIIGTRLRSWPPPWRLCYEGTVIRRRRGRARTHREIAQVGAECVGITSPHADAEMLLMALQSCKRVGLTRGHIELGHVGLGLSLLARVDEPARGAMAHAISQKDAGMLHKLLRMSAIDKEDGRKLCALLELHGEPSILDHARKLFRDPSSRRALVQLEQLVTQLDHSLELGTGEMTVGVDLGELRKFSYYTGITFSIYAEGPGEPIAEGGRYDQFVGRFGMDAPATGFGFLLDNLEWALEQTSVDGREQNATRWVVASESPAWGLQWAKALRDEGLVAATVPFTEHQNVRAFMNSWGYRAALVDAGSANITVLRAADHAQRTVASRAWKANWQDIQGWVHAAPASKDEA
jgi:ATP phosphoribosyltransferase regulatory subunit